MIPFVGPSYQLKTKRQGVQRSVNLMPTLIESGSGKAAVYLKPVPGLVGFSGEDDGGGGGAPPDGVFTAPYISDSCNYGFFPRGGDGTSGSLGGGFILITDTYGSDGYHPGVGFELKLVKFNADGEVVEEVNVSEYVSQLQMTTYDHDGFIYVGPVYHLATNKLHIVKVNRDTLAVTFVAMLDTDDWKCFHLLNDADLVLINTNVFVTDDAATCEVVNLDTGSVVHTVDLPSEIEPANVAQAVGGSLYIAFDGDLLECDYDTGAVLNTYTDVDLGITGYTVENVQRVDDRIAVYSWKTGPAAAVMGILDEVAGELEGIATGFTSRMQRWDRWVYRASDDSFYFVDFTAATAFAYGYSLTTLAVTYTQEVDLQWPEGGGAVNVGDGSYVGSIDDSDTVYLSVFTGVRAGEFGDGASNVIVAIPPL